MQTCLSSSAAPDAQIGDLLAGVKRHGLSGLELRVGDGHGLDAVCSGAALTAKATDIREAGVRVVALLDGSDASPPMWRRLVEILGTRLRLDGSLPLDERLGRARQAAAATVPVEIVVRGPEAAVEAQACVAAGYNVVWEAHPSDPDLGTLAVHVLQAAGSRLAGVRLMGGGPESTLHEGRGFGTLMAQLALAGFGGTLVVAPSDPKYHVLWDSWIGRRNAWGCGSAGSDSDTVAINHAGGTQGRQLA